MSEADVTFVIDGNDAGLTAAVSRGVRSLRRLDDEMDEARASTARTDSAIRGFSGSTDKGAKSAQGFTMSAEKMGQAVSLVSPRLGELTAKIGGLGAAGGPLVAAAAGMLAVVGAGVAVGRMALETARNIDELAASLSEADRIGVRNSIASLEEQKARLDDASDGWTQLKIVASAAVGGPLTDYIYVVGNVAEVTAEASQETDTWLADLALMPAKMATPLFVLDLYRQGISSIADAWREYEKAQADAARPAGGRFSMVADANAPSTSDLTFDVIKDAEQRREQARKDAQAAAAQREAASDKAFADITSLFSEIDAQILANAQAADDAAFAAYSEQWDARVKAAEDGAARILAAQVDALNREDAYRTAVREHEAEMLKASQAATMQAIDLTLSSIANVAAMLGSLTDSQLAADESRALSAAKTEEQRDRIRKDYAMRAWRADKAQALAQAAIQIPLSVLTGLSQGGPVLAAVNGALAAIQLGVIAATPPPKFHVGGMAPDERMNRGAIMRDNEAAAVLTAQGRQSITPDILALANAGLLGRDGTPSVTVVMDGRASRTRPFATNPSTGIARR